MRIAGYLLIVVLTDAQAFGQPGIGGRTLEAAEHLIAGPFNRTRAPARPPRGPGPPPEAIEHGAANRSTGIRREFHPVGVVERANGTVQANVPFLHEIVDIDTW